MAGYADERERKKEGRDSEGYWFRLEIHEENKAAEALETVWGARMERRLRKHTRLRMKQS